MLTFADALEALTQLKMSGKSPVITEAAIDSRQVIPGGMFVALPGERVDGHDYIGAAFDRGASFALIQRDVDSSFPTIDLRHPEKLALDSLNLDSPVCIRVDNSLTALQQVARFWRRKLDIKVVGITGSVGKSTTKEVVADVLGMRYRTLRNPGNLNNEIGLPLTVLRLGPGYEYAVLEMGFYVPGEIEFLCDIALPHIGVVTNVGTVHAERAGSQEAIARGKSELVQSLPADGFAVLNYDDAWVRAMAEKTKSHVFYYGLDAHADLWADRVEGLGLEGIRFRLQYQREVLHLRVPMIGRHSVHTALRGAAVGLVAGLTWQEIIGGLRQGHSQLRLVAVRTESGALILDDTYNASPESTLAALNLLSELDGRKIAVLGDMLELGPYERQGHEMVGARVAEVANILVTVGNLAHIIAETARKAGMKKPVIFEFENTDGAIDWLRTNLSSNDTALIKGSHGLRMDRIVSALEVQ